MAEEEPALGTYHLYIDESGEFGRKEGSSQYFIMTAINTQFPKSLRKRLWKKKAELYGLGWPKDIEIKGTSLWGSHHNPKIPTVISDKRAHHINAVLSAVLNGPVRVYYSVVRKAGLKPHLFEAEDGILFNWIAGNLLVRAYPNRFAGPLNIIVDQRSKETHNKLKFDWYVENRLIADAGHDKTLNISHGESHTEFGLQAVDFISWALFRSIEHGDDQFIHSIAHSVDFVDNWYVGKRCPGQ